MIFISISVSKLKAERASCVAFIYLDTQVQSLHVKAFIYFVSFSLCACYFCALVTCYSGDIEEIRWKFGSGSTYQKAQKARARYNSKI
jgi:hypothetical protein